MLAMSPAFLPGLELSRRFYAEAVAPLLRAHAGTLPHGAARLGTGSEVLGFDTARSADHEWGPRLQLFLRPEDAASQGPDIIAMLSQRLPRDFLGYPTHFAGEGPVRIMTETTGPVSHRVDVTDLGTWCENELGFDPRAGVSAFDWLATPTQRLAETTAGAVFHDDLGELVPLRERLRWYPTEVWRYVLACQWQRVSQEEAFVGRAGEVGDELGSAVVAARLVRDLMRLALLQQRRYPPYAKWLGSAFARLPAAAPLVAVLRAALSAADWHERERHLCEAYEYLADAQNALGLASPVDPTTRPYHGRPFRVLHAERFAEALRAGLTDDWLRALPPIGAVDQFLDNTDLLTDPVLLRATVLAAYHGTTDDR
jgi:hypothetical protein